MNARDRKMDHEPFTFYILGEVSEWMRYMQILQEPGKIFNS